MTSKFRWEWTIARVFGAPLSIHVSALGMIVLAWSFALHPAFATVLASFVSLLVLMASHEIGHALVAHRLGLHVYRMRLLFWHGRCEYEAPQDRAQAIAVAWGGVGVQFALFVAALALANVIRVLNVDLPLFVSQIIFMLSGFNLLMIALNLLPLRPLDGAVAWLIVPDIISRIRSTFVVRSSVRKIARKSHVTLVRNEDNDK